MELLTELTKFQEAVQDFRRGRGRKSIERPLTIGCEDSEGGCRWKWRRLDGAQACLLWAAYRS